MMRIDSLTPVQENAITEKQLKSESLNGRYYSYEKHAWESMGFIEYVIRTILFLFIDKPSLACLHRSWQAIDDMPNIPKGIANNIKDLFLDALCPSNSRSSYSGAISRIFCKTFQNNNQVDVQQHLTDRSFAVFHNKKLRYLVANSDYGILNFYNPKQQLVMSNDLDSLWSDDEKRINAIKLAVDYSSMDSAMELYTGDDLLLTKVVDNKEKASLIFRDALTNRLLAVGNLSKSTCLINWKITIIDQETLDQKQITPLLLAWTVLKYSQHHHFPSSIKLKYIDKPKIQPFKD